MQRGGIQKVWLRIAEQQPPVSNVRVTLARHFSFGMVSKHHRNSPVPLWPQLIWNKLSPVIPVTELLQTPSISWEQSASHRCLHLSYSLGRASMDTRYLHFLVHLQFFHNLGESCILTRKRSVDPNAQVCPAVVDDLVPVEIRYLRTFSVWAFKKEGTEQYNFLPKPWLWNLLFFSPERLNGTLANDTLKTI